MVLLALLYLVSTAPVPVLITLGRFLGRGRLSSYGAFVLPAIPLGVLLLVPYVGAGVGLAVLALGAGSRGPEESGPAPDRSVVAS